MLTAHNCTQRMIALVAGLAVALALSGASAAASETKRIPSVDKTTPRLSYNEGVLSVAQAFQIKNALNQVTSSRRVSYRQWRIRLAGALFVATKRLVCTEVDGGERCRRVTTVTGYL